MKIQTIRALNQLNQNFYTQVAPFFDDSRQYAWAGWDKLLPLITDLIKNRHLRVLDLAAGNQRFSTFLRHHFPEVKTEYYAIDANNYFAQKGALQLDIVDALVNESLVDLIKNQVGSDFDLIVSFGFLHHVPSFQLRQMLIHILLSLLTTPSSALVITAWQFAKDERQRKKIVDPKMVGLVSSELEKDDYILSWNRGVTAYRYCHHFTDDEVARLDQNGVDFTTFLADGQSSRLNRYLVWRS